MQSVIREERKVGLSSHGTRRQMTTIRDLSRALTPNTLESATISIDMAPRRNGPTRYRQPTLLSHFSSSSPPVSPKKRPRKAGRRATRRADSESSEPSSSDVIDVKPSPSKKQAILKEEPTKVDSDSSDVEKIKFEKSSTSAASSKSELSDDAGAPALFSQTIRNRVVDSGSSESEEEDIKPPPRRLKAPRRLKQELESSEEETPKKTRLIKRKESASEEEMSEEDDVLDGIDEKSEVIYIPRVSFIDCSQE